MMTTAQGAGSVSRILVATDLSTRSDRALRRATLIAKRLGSSLGLVHVVEADQPRRMIEAERLEAQAVLEETVRTSCTVDGVAADVRVVVDDAPSGILSAAEDFNAELIVLGPHRSQFRDVFAGTTVERVVRRSRFPLLVAVQPPSSSYERTLLAFNFDDASEAAARGALGMGIFERTAVTIMHAFDAPAAGMMRRSMVEPDAIEDYVADERAGALKRLHEYAAKLGLPATNRSVVAITSSPARSIFESARDERSDLVVLGTSKKSGVKRVLIGSVTEQVLRDAERDILIIPADYDDDIAAGGPLADASTDET
jgi:nucleotide-binding universal stress UspA family protein